MEDAMDPALVESLIEQGMIADRLESDIEIILTKKDLNLRQAMAIYTALIEAEATCRATIHLIMEEGDVDEDLQMLIDNLNALWDDLSAVCANKLCEIQGIAQFDPDQQRKQ